MTKSSRRPERLPWSVVVFLCLTLGLAPFNPPHVWEKLTMLAAGRLTRPIDIFDLGLHGLPWLLLAVKLAAAVAGRRSTPARDPADVDR